MPHPESLPSRRCALRIAAALLASSLVTPFRPVSADQPDAAGGGGHSQNRSACSAPAPSYFIYGKSVQGRLLSGVTFGTGPNCSLIMAAIHGNERNARPLAERLIAYLSAHPEAYAGCAVTVLPCLNPDGWAHDTRVNAHKVDLNRNFPVGWHGNVPGKLNRGASALSEPESAALVSLVAKLRPYRIVSIHNPLHLLDWSDGKSSKDLADLIASYDHYPAPQVGVGYPTPGSFGQYAASINAAVVTLELPREPVADAWAQNEAALLAVIKSEVNFDAPVPAVEKNSPS